MTRKKNRFLTFCFSLLPGAAEMYMGFMKMGLSLMLLFFGIIVVASFIEIGPLMIFGFVVWFYGFFHANNLASMPDSEFVQVEDSYLFNISDIGMRGKMYTRKNGRIVAIVLIILGALLCFRGVSSMALYYLPDYVRRIINTIGNNLPQVIVGAAIIALGVNMIKGKKKELIDNGDN